MIPCPKPRERTITFKFLQMFLQSGGRLGKKIAVWTTFTEFYNSSSAHSMNLKVQHLPIRDPEGTVPGDADVLGSGWDSRISTFCEGLRCENEMFESREPHLGIERK